MNGSNNTAGPSSATNTVKPEPGDHVKAEDLAAWSGYDTSFLPAAFELNVPALPTTNTYIFKEKKRDSVVVRDGALGKRKREKGESWPRAVSMSMSMIGWLGSRLEEGGRGTEAGSVTSEWRCELRTGIRDGATASPCRGQTAEATYSVTYLAASSCAPSYSIPL